MVSFNHTPSWLSDFSSKFLEGMRNKELDTLVAQVHTSIGQTIEAKPEDNLIERLKASRKDG